jgi:uncharacterized hydrophobic protein (TIGR00271 family)
MFLLNASQSSILRATREEKNEAIARLIASAGFRRGYYLLLTLSVAIVTAGLLTNSPAVIIGGMLMAPVLVPILSLSLSIVTRSVRGIMHSLRVMVASLLWVFFLSFTITWVFAFTEMLIPWIPEIVSPGLYIFIAFCAGVAAAFAWVKEDLAPSIAGVAVAVSLLPPLCAVGIGSAMGDVDLASTSFLLFLLNVAGMLLGAVLVFLLLGFFAARTVQEKELKKEESVA